MFSRKTATELFFLEKLSVMELVPIPCWFYMHKSGKRKAVVEIWTSSERKITLFATRAKLPLLLHCINQVEPAVSASLNSTGGSSLKTSNGQNISNLEHPASTTSAADGGARNVPYPRTSGARFSSNGRYLVTFGRCGHYLSFMSIYLPLNLI